MSGPRSLVLITVDCLRFDHVGFNGYSRPTTPFLDQLAKESIVISNAVVAGSPTYFSFPAIMASRHPLALGRDLVGLAPGEPTIASALNDSGYATAAFLAANPYLARRFGYDSGFDTFEDFLDANPGEKVIRIEAEGSQKQRINRRLAKISHRLGLIGHAYDELYFRYCQRLARNEKKSLDQLRRFPAADVMVKTAAEWLSVTAGRPFFLWLHLMDPHSPYYPQERALDRMGQTGLNAHRARYLNSYWNRGDLKPDRLTKHREEIIALYNAGIRWVDEQIACLVQTLRESQRWDNCVFALTADHGEEFLEHGDRYHSPAKLIESLVHVPLLLRIPKGQGASSSDAPFSLLDLGPTLLEAAGNGVPAQFRGRSRWKNLTNGKSWEGYAIIESVADCNNPYRTEDRLRARVLAVREARFQLTLDFRSGEAQLFDLKADPQQRSPLPGDAEKAVRSRLLEAAAKHLAQSVQLRSSEDVLHARLREVRLEWAH